MKTRNLVCIRYWGCPYVTYKGQSTKFITMFHRGQSSQLITILLGGSLLCIPHGWGNYNVLSQFGAQTHQFPISEASEFPLMAAPHRQLPLKELTKPAGVSRGKT